MSFNKMTIGKKIGSGFTVLLVLLLIVGGLNFFGVGRIVDDAGLVIDGNKLDAELAQREVDHFIWAGKVSDLLNDEHVTELNVQTDYHQCGLGKWFYGKGRQEAEQLVPELSPVLAKLEEPHQKLHQSAIAIADAYKPADPHLAAKMLVLEIAHLNWAAKVRDALLQGEKSLVGVQADPTKCGLGKWLISAEYKTAYDAGSAEFKRLLDTIPEGHQRLHQSATAIAEKLAANNPVEAQAVFREETLPMLHSTVAIIRELHLEAEKAMDGQSQARGIFSAHTSIVLKEVQKLLHQSREVARRSIMTDVAMLKAAKETRVKVSMIVGVAILIGIALATFVTRLIVKFLKEISLDMDDSANQVSFASQQISSSSESLAEGASEQAASLEETSASLEEVNAMVKQNAENAGQADAIMKETRQAISNADASMQNLTTSMQEIAKASEDTQKIVKTIDEIAFQTNLLALNAAVEAARAGEAGAGFAVVADEVRNLAMRAAESAKNTSDLIAGTVSKVSVGVAHVATTSDSLQAASQSTDKISNLVTEIAVGAQEQAQGISGITRAVMEIDQVTQRTAANAEEVASASEEMDAQSVAMKDHVAVMLLMLGQAANEASGADPSLLALEQQAPPRD